MNDYKKIKPAVGKKIRCFSKGEYWLARRTPQNTFVSDEFPDKNGIIPEKWEYTVKRKLTPHDDREIIEKRYQEALEIWKKSQTYYNLHRLYIAMKDLNTIDRKIYDIRH